jgi:hypothetical protein
VHQVGLFTGLLRTSSHMLKLSSTFVMSEILVTYCFMYVRKRLLAYLFAGLLLKRSRSLTLSLSCFYLYGSIVVCVDKLGGDEV